jgi:hypothetical protein
MSIPGIVATVLIIALVLLIAATIYDACHHNDAGSITTPVRIMLIIAIILLVCGIAVLLITNWRGSRAAKRISDKWDDAGVPLTKAAAPLTWSSDDDADTW